MSNNYEAFGRIKKILPLHKTASGFVKNEFILVTDEEHSQAIKFEVHGKKLELLSTLFIGDSVKLSFNIRGFEYVTETGDKIYFNSFIVWKINKIENGYPQPNENGRSPHFQHNFNLPPANEVFGNNADEEHDDLPF